MLASASVTVGAFVGLLIVTAAEDQAAIRAARTARNKALEVADLDRVASYWTEDVTVRRALGQALSGRLSGAVGETRRAVV